MAAASESLGFRVCSCSSYGAFTGCAEVFTGRVGVAQNCDLSCLILGCFLLTC